MRCLKREDDDEDGEEDQEREGGGGGEGDKREQKNKRRKESGIYIFDQYLTHIQTRSTLGKGNSTTNTSTMHILNSTQINIILPPTHTGKTKSSIYRSFQLPWPGLI